MKASQVLAGALIAFLAAVPVFAKKDKDAKAPVAASASGAGAIVATVGGEVITADELDKAASSQLMKIRQQEYDVKSDVLDSLIQKKLLDKEAANRKVSLADLLKAEVEDKTAAVAKEDVDKFYEQNKARMGNRTREDVGPDIERSLKMQKQAERRNAFLNDLLAKSQVKILLDPPRIPMNIPATAHAKAGPETAPITLVEFSDYQCPFCRRAHPTIEKLRQEYGDKIRFVYRDYPLSFHPRANPASNAARCAVDQGKFWEFHKNLMEVQGDLSDSDLAKRATDLGLDAAAFNACYGAKKYDASIKEDFDAGAAVGVTGTPAFFINGRMVVGAQPIEQFRQVIDDELQRAGITPPTHGTN